MTVTNTIRVASAVRQAAVIVSLNLLWPELQVTAAKVPVFDGEAGNFASVVADSLVAMLGRLGIGSLWGLLVTGAPVPLESPLWTTRFAMFRLLFERFLVFGIIWP